MRNAAGAPVYSGPISIDGKGYTLAASDFGVGNDALTHLMHGLSVKSNTKGVWDWEVAGSIYDYQKDQVRAATTAQPGSLSGSAGTLQDQNGTGWNTLAFKGIWRPEGIKGAHTVYEEPSLIACYTPQVLKAAAQLSGDDPATFRVPSRAYAINVFPQSGEWQWPRPHIDHAIKEAGHKTFPRAFRIAMMTYLSDVPPHGAGTIVWPVWVVIV